MKIVHLSTSDDTGGAAIAASRLHRGLCSEGFESQMLVSHRGSDDPHTRGVHSRVVTGLRRRFDRLPLIFERAPATIAWRSLAWLPNRRLVRAVAAERPDLIHLHWTQNGFLPIGALRRLSVPLVWTFHDMWPVCGALHHEDADEGRHTHVPERDNRPSDRRGLDLDCWTWKRKRAAYEGLKIEAVVPSRWMAEQVLASALWADRPVTVVPNGLDTELFSPLPRAEARQRCGLPDDSKLILFGAMYASGDPNKGYPQLRTALETLSLPREGTELVVFGMDDPGEGESPLPYRTHWMGVLRDPRRLAELYAAADVMVVPSLQESFGQTASEPMACGTPVVAFDTSGLKDIVVHRETGYLAQVFDPEDLAAGIRWVLEDDERKARLVEASRQRAVAEFSLPAVVRRQAEVYARAIQECTANTADSGRDRQPLPTAAIY